MTEYRANSVDVLKAIAVISVVLYHSNQEMFKTGFLGVDIFLVVTGFLSAQSLERSGAWPFIVSRFFRIYPGLLLYLFVIMTLVLTFGYFAEVRSAAKYSFSSLILATNVMMQASDGYFSDQVSLPYYHLWSISLEFQSWILIAIIYVFRNVRSLLFILCLTSLGYFALELDANNLDKIYLPVYARVWEVAIGALIFQFFSTSSHVVSRHISVLLIGSLILSILLFELGVVNWLMVVVISAALLVSNISLTGRFAQIVRDVSLNTYGVYLWHVLILFVLKEFSIGVPLTMVLVFPISFLISKSIRRWTECI